MDSLLQLRSRLNNSISIYSEQIDNNNSFIEETEKILSSINIIISEIKNKTYKIDDSQIDLIREKFSEMEKMIEAFIIVGYGDYEFLKPQKVAASNYLDTEALNVLEKIKVGLEESISNRKRKNEEFLREISQYQEFLSLFNEEEFIKGVDEESFSRLFKYINDTNLSVEVILDLTMLLGMKSIDTAIYEYKKRQDKIRFVTSKNARLVLDSIDEEVKEVSEYTEDKTEISHDVGNIFDVGSLSQDERAIHDKIIKILNEYKGGMIGNSKLDAISIDDLGLDVRKNIYSIDDFGLICFDIKNNLLPRLNNDNKESILAIFSYVISLYEKKNRRLESVSVIPEFSLEEQKSIQWIMERLKSGETKEIFERNRNLVLSYASSIDENARYIDILNNISGGEVSGFDDSFLLISLMNNLYDVYQEYLNLIKDERKMVMQEDDRELVEQFALDYMNSIRNYLRLIDEYCEHQNALTVDLSETVSKGHAQNVLIVLDYDGLIDDYDALTEKNIDVSASYRKILDGLSMNTMGELRSANSTTVLKPRKKGKGINDPSEQFSLKQFKFGNVCAFGVWLPINAVNKEVIKNVYNVKDGNVLLIVGFSYFDSGIDYIEFYRRKAKCSEKIFELVTLFRENFNSVSFEKVKEYIDESDRLNSNLSAGISYGFGGGTR